MRKITTIELEGDTVSVTTRTVIGYEYDDETGENEAIYSEPVTVTSHGHDEKSFDVLVEAAEAGRLQDALEL